MIIFGVSADSKAWSHNSVMSVTVSPIHFYSSCWSEMSVISTSGELFSMSWITNRMTSRIFRWYLIVVVRAVNVGAEKIIYLYGVIPLIIVLVLGRWIFVILELLSVLHGLNNYRKCLELYTWTTPTLKRSADVSLCGGRRDKMFVWNHFFPKSCSWSKRWNVSVGFPSGVYWSACWDREIYTSTAYPPVYYTGCSICFNRITNIFAWIGYGRCCFLLGVLCPKAGLLALVARIVLKSVFSGVLPGVAVFYHCICYEGERCFCFYMANTGFFLLPTVGILILFLGERE